MLLGTCNGLQMAKSEDARKRRPNLMFPEHRYLQHKICRKNEVTATTFLLLYIFPPAKKNRAAEPGVQVTAMGRKNGTLDALKKT